MSQGKPTAKIVLDRLKQTAIFVKSVLHLSFPDLDRVNPSFGVLSKYCNLMAEILIDEAANKNAEKAHELARILAEVAEAVVDKSDRNIVDCMAELDEFLQQFNAGQTNLKVV